MTDIRLDDHDEISDTSATSGHKHAFARRVKVMADAIPVPSLAQVQDAVDTLSSAKTDEIIREGEDIEFGYAALELAQDLLAVGALPRAIRWLRVAADRDIPGADGQLEEVIRLHRASTFEVQLSPAPPRLAVSLEHKESESLLPNGWNISPSGRIFGAVAARDDVEADQAGALKGEAEDVAAIRSAKDTAARIIDVAHARADQIVAEARTCREHARDPRWSITELLDRQLLDVASRPIMWSPLGSGKSRIVSSMVRDLITRGGRSFMVTSSNAEIEQTLWTIDHAEPCHAGRGNAEENQSEWLRSSNLMQPKNEQCTHRAVLDPATPFGSNLKGSFAALVS